MSIITDRLLIEKILSRGVESVYPSRDAFFEALVSGKQLTMYLGIDPTGPTLHVGHMVQIRKLAEFQRLGHRIILLIGDFTATIGDPTDKMATRKPLTREEVLANSRLYKKQASKFLNFKSKDNPATFLYNSKWLDKMNFENILQLASHVTVQRLLERDMFEKRMSEGKPIHLHEFLYPIMQGYDSVAMNVDVEVCGNDQVFNTLVGRDLVKKYLNKEKFVIANRLLVDPTGKKMGKSEGNMIAMTDTPEDMFGKIMAIPDELIWAHFELLTDLPMDQIGDIKRNTESGANPRDAKMTLAFEIVKTFLNESKAKRARSAFINIFQNKAQPVEMPMFHVSKQKLLSDGKITPFELFLAAGLVTSKNETRRLIEQKGLSVNQQLVTSIDHDFQHETSCVLQKGKRHFATVIFED